MKTIGYLTIGYPDLETSIRLAEAYVEGGCDAIEMGMPTENPFMEGKNIADKMKAALAMGVSYQRCFDAIYDFSRRHPETEIFPIFYKEIFLRLGYENIVAFCERCHITKVLSVDMDQDIIIKELAKRKIYFVSFFGFDVSETDMQKAVENQAFVYMAAVKRPADVLKPGIETMKDILEYMRREGVTCPIYCGGGIRTPEDVRQLRNSGADGFFLGSSLMDWYTDLDGLKAEIQKFKDATK